MKGVFGLDILTGTALTGGGGGGGGGGAFLFFLAFLDVNKF